MNSPKIKVLHLIESLGRGGAERLLATTIKWLNKEKFESIVCSLFEATDFKKEIEENGGRVFVLNLRSKSDIRNGIFRLHNLISKNRIDVVHTHLFFANIYGRLASRLANVKCVITTLHNPDYTYEDNRKISFKIRKISDRLTGKFISTSFIAVSEAVKRDYLKWMGFKNINVLYNSIDLNDFKPDPFLDIQEMRSSLGLNREDFVLLNIGRLHPQKGQVYLIEAVKLLRTHTDINFKLIIAGEGWLYEDLAKMIRNYNLQDRVFLIGKTANVRFLIQISDIFIFPSIYEALGVALIEAMAMAKPVIATGVEGLLEVVTNEEDGLLVKSRDASGLAEAIIRLYRQKDFARILGQKAQKKVEENFNIEKNIRKLENFYMSLLKRRSDEIAGF